VAVYRPPDRGDGDLRRGAGELAGAGPTRRWTTLLATMALLAALAVTAAGVWWVEVRGGAGPDFPVRAGDVRRAAGDGGRARDGRPDSPYPPLYILVITAAALLLPLPGGMLIGALASLLFMAGRGGVRRTSRSR
jgi:hypothetical protein